MLLSPDHADSLQAGGRAQLQRGLHRTCGVRRPVADLPRAEIQKPAPVVRRVVRAVGAHRSAAQPCLPVERPRHGRFGRLRLHPRGMRARRGRNVRFGHIADRARPYDLRRHPVALVREALVAHLRGHFVFRRRFHQQARFPRRPRQRLLHVDVLAVLHAGQRHRGVHEIRNADGDGVDVLAFLLEHHAEIFVLGLLVELLEVGRRPRFIHIAQRHDVLGLRRVVEIHAALPPAADRSHVELIVEGLVPQRPERRHAAVTCQRNRSRQETSVEKMPSGNTVL